ncbi:MAG: hypothetical protein RIS47_2057 [Bacteroidota bacterium]|jgi:hypothetical protein
MFQVKQFKQTLLSLFLLVVFLTPLVGKSLHFHTHYERCNAKEIKHLHQAKSHCELSFHSITVFYNDSFAQKSVVFNSWSGFVADYDSVSVQQIQFACRSLRAPPRSVS